MSPGAVGSQQYNQSINLNIEEMSDVFSLALNGNLIPLSECKPPELGIKSWDHQESGRRQQMDED